MVHILSMSSNLPVQHLTIESDGQIIKITMMTIIKKEMENLA